MLKILIIRLLLYINLFYRYRIIINPCIINSLGFLIKYCDVFLHKLKIENNYEKNHTFVSICFCYDHYECSNRNCKKHRSIS